MFTPPKKRTHGQCACHPLVMRGTHLPDCPALYPLQPQPGDTPAPHGQVAQDWMLVDAGLWSDPDGLGSDMLDSMSADLSRLAAKAARTEVLEERLRGYETAATITNDHLSRALRMGQQQGRAELATELLEVQAENREDFLRNLLISAD